MTHPRIISAMLALLALSAGLRAQTPQQIRNAFANIRSDEKPLNGIEAAEWLAKHREKIKGDLVTELYKTDRQGRDAILMVLFRTKSFVPDERFARFLMARLPEQNSKVDNLALGKLKAEEEEKESSRIGAHWEAWQFIDEHYELFEPLLVEWIGKTNDMLSLWGTSWLMKKRGVFDQHAALFTPEVLTRIAGHLIDDKRDFNAGQAVRIFLILGDRSLPALRQAAQAKDPQGKSLARALLDALKGTRKAFSFLSTKSNLTITPFGAEPEDPEWIGDEMAKLTDLDNYP